MSNKSNWDSYQSCLRAAILSRNFAVHFARCEDWAHAYGHAASAKTAQTKANDYFERYIDALALDDFERYLDALALDDVSEHTCTSCLRPELDCSLNPCDAVKADRIG